jgi:hypothetical protein
MLTDKEFIGMAHISTASWEEEAGPKALFKVSAGDSTRNRRFSRAG